MGDRCSQMGIVNSNNLTRSDSMADVFTSLVGSLILYAPIALVAGVLGMATLVRLAPLLTAKRT